MSLVLSTNINAMVAQNALTSSGSQLASALQQLSTGLRINTAADDAAGYAIVNGMTSQINGLHQAARNANDGVSLAQTGSGALSEIVNDLQTMRDLAVQSLNATNSANDRADLDQQFQQLKADINNVAKTTQFNGVTLLDGTFQGATFQVGANAGQTITVSSVSSAASDNLGQVYSLQGADLSGAGAYTGAAGDVVSFNITSDNAAVPAAGVTTGNVTLTGNQTTDMKTIAAAINQAVGGYGAVATVDTAHQSINLSSTTSQTLTFTTTATAAGGGAGAETGATFGVTEGANAVTTAGNFLDQADVKSVDGSNLVLIQVDAALQQLAATGAQLGAYQNRFQAAVTGLNTDATNLASARSQIQDTDYATATSQLTKAQILQQAGTAMVAQANTIPQNVLTLLNKLA
jgi:flagellin